jgi:hypothetical protein
MSTPDPFPVGGRQDDDAKVRRLFWRWQAAQRAFGMTDGDEGAAYERICVIEDQILAMHHEIGLDRHCRRPLSSSPISLPFALRRTKVCRALSLTLALFPRKSSSVAA